MNTVTPKMIKKVVHTNQAPAAIGAYSQAIQIGNLVYTSGQIPVSPSDEIVEGGMKEQTVQVMQNLKAVLEASGSSLSQVVKTTCFIKDMSAFVEFNEVYAQFFNVEVSPAPARSCVEVARLPKDVLVELEAIALI